MNVVLKHDFRIEAAHRLPKLPADHKCARLHGHSYTIRLAVRGPVDPDSGWLMDYQDMANAWAPLHEQLDHRYLNEIDGLENATSEHLAVWIWERLRPVLPQLCRVSVLETCEARCDYEGD